MTGTITRKEIIEDEALAWGAEYAKTVDLAIGKNKEFVDVVLAMKAANDALRNAPNAKDYIENQKKTNELGEKAITIWKEQDQLEKSLISTKKKNELATEGTNKALIKERTLLAETNKEIKLQARESLGLVSAYERLNRSRNDAQKRLADLLSAEKKNIGEIIIAQREYDKLDTRVKAVDAATKNYSKNIGNYQSAFKGLNGTMRELVSAFGLVTGIALFGTAVRDIFSVIKDFDRQLIAVGKTTNISGDALKDLGREVIELGDRLDGVTVDGLIQSAEVAGQLGVQGTANILKFSESIEKLKLTSNIISDEQVGQFAKFIEVSSDSFENADRLASVITRLGNEMATTEAEVLANSTEIQKGIAVYNTSAQGVLALGAATSTLGSEAESSRSAIQTTFSVINNAVATGAKLEKVLKLTGLTQAELSQQFNKDATGVFAKFVKGLNNAKNEGQNLSLVLNDLGITEKRAFTVVGSLAANYSVLENAMASASSEYELNAALNKEVESASKSLASIVGDIRDKYEAYVLTATSANAGTEKLAKALSFVRDNFASIVNFIIKAGTVLLTYLGVVKAVNFVIAASTALNAAWTAGQIRFALSTGIGTKAILEQAAAARAATIAQNGLNVATKATPWGLIIGLIAAVVVAYIAWNDEMSKSEKLVQKISENNKQLADDEKFYASQRLKNSESDFKNIEDEIALRKAKGEDVKLLEDEEIRRKKEIIQAQIDVFENLEKTENDRTRNLIKQSNLRIAQMIVEQNAGQTNGKRKDELTDLIEAEREKTALQKGLLQSNTTEAVGERKRLNDLLNSLDKDAAVKTAAAKLEEDKKAKAARLKAAKERYELAKKEADDDFKLRQFRMQVAIDMDNEILANDEAATLDRLNASSDANQLLIGKLELTAAYELSKLGKFNEEKGVFIRQMSDFEISELIRTGEARKKLTNEQKLIFETYQNELTKANKKGIEERDKLVDFDVAKFKEGVDRQLLLEDTKLQKALETQNILFQSELAGLNSNQKLIEDATTEHERKILEIKRAFAKDALRLQIDATEKVIENNDKIPENERASVKEIEDLQNKLATYRKLLSDENVENSKASNEQIVFYETKAFEDIKSASEDLTDALANLANALFERRIANIEAEIDKNNEYYELQIRLAGDDARKKDALQRQQALKNEQLEKKKRAEAHKQAVFNKALMLVQTIANTAAAVMRAFADSGYVGAILAGITGAAQIAVIASTQIPAYKDGRKGGPAEFAIVGDGGRSEVITSKDGSNPMVTPSRPTITHLDKDDKVFPSMAAYQDYVRASVLNDIGKQNKTVSGFISNKSEASFSDVNLINELRGVKKAIEKQRPIVMQKLDINHELWRMKQTNWRA